MTRDQAKDYLLWLLMHEEGLEITCTPDCEPAAWQEFCTFYHIAAGHIPATPQRPN